ncbi:MAG: hypothetical protein SCK28_10690 [Bacillota bacterium]|nr:hypothetical protein [Bacillota bacterium]
MLNYLKKKINVNNKEQTSEKIQASSGSVEKSVCSQCGFVIEGVEPARCPRCFSLVVQHTCGGCGRCKH